MCRMAYIGGERWQPITVWRRQDGTLSPLESLQDLKSSAFGSHVSLEICRDVKADVEQQAEKEQEKEQEKEEKQEEQQEEE